MSGGPLDSALVGLRVLLVEDESLLAMDIELLLQDFGCRMVGWASTLDDALRLAETEEFDLAVLDVSVARKMVFPVAEILARRDIPFLFTTGYGRESVREDLRDRPILRKPYSPEQLRAAMLIAVVSRPHSLS